MRTYRKPIPLHRSLTRAMTRMALLVGMMIILTNCDFSRLHI
jgi:hypothetical protein